MCINDVVSNYLGLVPHGKTGIEMQHEGKKIAVFNLRKSTRSNWREAVQFSLEWHKLLFDLAGDAQSVAERTNRVVYTWQCSGVQNWLRRGASIVDALCYTVLPLEAPESIRLPDDEGDTMPQDESQ